jgi:hypothetical protein
MNYTSAKGNAIDVVDDFTKLDVVANYGGKFTAKTKLDSIGIPDVVRAVMPPRTNKVFRKLVQPWVNVGTVELVQCSSIGDFIKLVCGKAGISIPMGEPK